MNEEITARIGLDTQGVAAGLQTARAHLSNFAESMKNVASGARQGWKSAVKSISEESGIAGLALKAIINPVSAALTGGVMVFKWASDAIKRWNEEMDLAQATSAIPVDNIKLATEKANEALKHYASDWDKWLKSHDRSVQSITEGLKQHLDLMTHQKKLADELIDRAKARALLEGKDPKQVEAAANQAKSINDYGTVQHEIDARKKADAELRKKQGAAGADVSGAKSDLDNFDMTHFENRKFAIKNLEESQKTLGSEADKATAAADEKPNAWLPYQVQQDQIARKNEAKEQAIRARDANQALLEKERSAQKNEQTRLDSIQDRLKKGESTYDNYGSQIDTNKEALGSLGFKREEMLATMDPAQRRKLIQSQAGSDFAAERARIYKKYGAAYNPKTGGVADAATGQDFNQTMVGDRAKNFADEMRGATGKFNEDMNGGKDVSEHVRNTASTLKSMLEKMTTTGIKLDVDDNDTGPQ